MNFDEILIDLVVEFLTLVTHCLLHPTVWDSKVTSGINCRLFNFVRVPSSTNFGGELVPSERFCPADFSFSLHIGCSSSIAGSENTVHIVIDLSYV